MAFLLIPLGMAMWAVPATIGVTSVGPIAGGLFAVSQAAGYVGAGTILAAT